MLDLVYRGIVLNTDLAEAAFSQHLQECEVWDSQLSTCLFFRLPSVSSHTQCTGLSVQTRKTLRRETNNYFPIDFVILLLVQLILSFNINYYVDGLVLLPIISQFTLIQFCFVLFSVHATKKKLSYVCYQQSTLNLNRDIYTHTHRIFYFWKVHMCVFTIELSLVSPPGWRPISASLLASSTLLTPQFGATFPLQRIWTFILQTTDVKTQHTRWASQDNINKTDGYFYGDQDGRQKERKVLLQCNPCRTTPHSKEPQWSQKVGTL